MSFQAMAWAVDQKLPTLQKFVLLMLANRTNHDTGRCDPSHERLADDCGMSKASVKRAIRALAEAGYLSVENRTKNGEKQTNQYRLHLDRVGSDRPHPQSGGGDVGSDRPEVGSDRPEVGSDRPEGVGSQGAIKQESPKQEVNQEDNLQSLPALPAVAVSPALDGKLIGAKSKAKKLVDEELQADCRAIWSAYAAAYQQRYGVAPVRNAKVNNQVKQLAARIPREEAPAIAAFYVSVNDSRLINDCHPVGSLLAKAEAFRTQWATGRQITTTTAQQIERKQANLAAGEEAARRITERRSGGGRNEFL